MPNMAPDRLLAPYRGLPRSVYIQLVCSLVSNLGGTAELFLPLYLHSQHGVDTRWVGIMISAFGLGIVVGSSVGGQLSDRYDNHRLAKWFLAGSACCMMLLAQDFPLWIIVSILLVSGLFDGAFRPVNQRLALEPCAPEQRPRAQGLLRVAFNLGVALGSMIGGFLAQIGYQWVYLSNGVATALAALWIALAYRHVILTPPFTHTSRDNTADQALEGPWRDIPYLRLIAGVIITSAVIGQLYSMVGLYLVEQNHLSPRWLGILFTINCLMVICLQVPIAERINRWGIARCTQWGVMLCGASYLLLLVGTNPLWPILMIITQTFAELLIEPTFMYLVMHRSEGRLRGRYLGLYSSVWASYMLFAPTLGAWVYGTLGGTALWTTAALAALLAALIQFTPVRVILAKHT